MDVPDRTGPQGTIGECGQPTVYTCIPSIPMFYVVYAMFTQRKADITPAFLVKTHAF